MIGTLVGAAAIVVLTACFPQSRAGFLVGLALWGATCALVATLLRNFASSAPALAGYTAAIIANAKSGRATDSLLVRVDRKRQAGRPNGAFDPKRPPEK
jgi:hypothetical protein